MQVNSVSTSVVNANQSFGRRNLDREYLEQFAELDDKSLKQLAYQNAAYKVNDKKHKRISNALYYSIPIAAGLAAIVRTPAKIVAEIAKKAKISPRTVKFNNFAGTALNWAGTFLAIDLVFGAKRKLDKSSKTVNEFSNNHPILSTLATIGVTIGAMFAAGKGISKLAAKAPKARVDKMMNALDKKLVNNKVLNKMSEKLSKVPSAIKNITKGVIDFGPLLLICSSIAHSFNHQNVKASETVKVYDELKTAQSQIRTILDKSEENAEEV